LIDTTSVSNQGAAAPKLTHYLRTKGKDHG
jgi:hypothetical protein